jgi:hypothetical protein
VLRTDLGEATAGAARILRASDPERIQQLVDRMNA